MSDPLPSLFIRYFRLFWGYAGPRMFMIVVLTLIMTYVEGIGLAMFYPLFQTPGQATSNASGMIEHLLHALHVPLAPASVLPLIVALFLVKGLLQYVVTRYQFALTTKVTRQLRRRALTAIESADFQEIAGTNAGFFTNLLVSEIARASSGFQYFVRSLPPALSASTLFVMVCILDWRLSLACILMGGVMIALSRITGFVIRRYSLIVSRESSILTGLLIQMLHGFKYLRATGAYQRFDGRVWATSERVLEADFKGTMANALLVSMSQPIMVVFLGAMLFYRAVIQGGELASLFVLLLYFFRVMTEVLTLQSSWQQFCGYVGSVDLVNDAIDRAEQAPERTGDQVFDGVRTAITFDQVGFAYRTGGRVLDNINLEIPANTTVAFVGGSGAGKSTLVDLLTGTLTPSTGTVAMDGHSVALMNLATLRRRVGYVPQDAILFDDTVAANIKLWSDDYTPEQVRDAAKRARCLEFIERMPQQFDTPIGDRGIKLSGGQRQRLAIARELLRRPDILVLDEATSALDSESELAIQQSIDQLKGTMTIVIIAHRLSTVRTSDQVFVLADGRLVEHGPFDELSQRPGGMFRKMCELQELAA